ncbi:hypothetical protein LTR09_012194 [Extremus antarcticus]|uniref:Class II aldolase/adducin N-terminal domain-containing protein n=1 Tax=Extremus antarcticus TaxID=702011 RepID=A0AAJ0D594_9PEZI|nr:hypothetical protein LTR09_012194 [Extremus antarcticus]
MAASNQSDDTKLHQMQHDLISACHILHHHHILDAFGHISFRHPLKDDVFVMSRNMAPGTVTSPTDLVEYSIKNAEPLDPAAPRGFLERYIHSECYKKHSAVRSVVHSHSEAVVPYTISGVPLRACFHMAGFLGNKVPVWDIINAQKPDDISDLLVRNKRLGASLAAAFGSHGGKEGHPGSNVALMRGHGFTILSTSIQDCVMKAIYTEKNATIQTTALLQRATSPSGSPPICYLSEKEIHDTTWSIAEASHRPWALWLREVERSEIYENLA